ncbi:MAG: (Fe-S)-binding protein [Desulfomonilaceae bacterium]|nr:(Fe-S)-binding protein [Desulfomonilaceae bacterium]
MAVEQEFADVYPLTAEILLEYLDGTDCRDCGFPSCTAFADALISGKARGRQCGELDPGIAAAIDALLDYAPPIIPYNVMMESLSPGIYPVGDPPPSSPVLVTCNFTETVRLLEQILKTCSIKAILLMSDTKGYSVDNAVAEKKFTPFEVLKVISHTEVGSMVNHGRLLIPGLAGHLKTGLATTTGWHVLKGPVSGFEIPLFLIREGLVQ